MIEKIMKDFRESPRYWTGFGILMIGVILWILNTPRDVYLPFTFFGLGMLIGDWPIFRGKPKSVTRR